MRHRKHKIILDRNAAQRQRLLRNLAISLISHESITTTTAKAKATRALVERLITIGKTGDLHARRQLITRLNSPAAANKILTIISPRFIDRRGGYIRAIKIGHRAGDNSFQVRLELISE